MRKFLLITLLALLGSACLAASALACSTFAVYSPEGTLFGRNTDGEMAIIGHLLVNKRGIEKRSVPWVFAGPASGEEDSVLWVSRYGSVTFTHFGREFPDGGVNEAGLIVEEMTLGGTVYPESDSRPSISVQQWIQYQLDNFSSVDEVISNADEFSIRGWPWHFTVADRFGRCATLEFIGGELEARSGVLENGCVLTNHRVAEALSDLDSAAASPAYLDKQDAFSTQARFVRAHDMLEAPVPGGDDARKQYAFEVLDAIAQGNNTFRSIAYDLGAGKIYFRTVEHRGIKEVDLGTLDFSPASPVTTLALDTPGSGDVTGDFSAYDAQANRETVAAVFKLIRATPWVSDELDMELAAASQTEEEMINRIAAYPQTTRVMETNN